MAKLTKTLDLVKSYPHAKFQPFILKNVDLVAKNRQSNL